MRTEPSFSANPDDHVNDQSFASDAESQLLADYRQRYGLSADPFADDPHFPFYTGAQRRQVLDHLLHLCQFSQNLLVVVGEYGVGKTRMAQALIDSLSDADDICFLEGQINSTYDSLIGDLLAQLELAGVDAFEEFIQRNSDQDSLAVVIIDNAHHLADDVLIDLLALVQANPESRLHLVMFAEPLLLDRLTHFNLPDLVISDFLLDKFSLSEAVDYLNFRMEMADYLGPEIFSEAKVEPWWRESQGQLLELHEHAQEKLLASVQPTKKAVEYRKGLPIPHIVAASVLGAGLLMTIIYWNGSSTSKTTSAPAALRELPITAASSVAYSNSVQVSSIAQTSVIVVQQSASTQTLSSVAAIAATSSVAATQKSEAPVVRQSVVPLAQTNAVKSESFVKASKSSQSSKEIKRSESNTDIAKTNVKSEEIRPAKALSQSGIYSDQEKVLLSWDESEYTLQLVGLSSEKAVREFVAEQPNKKDLLVFKSLRQGKDWFVVVTGRYSTSAKARQAAQLLPESQKKAAPWPRDLKTIQREIKQK